MRGFKTALAAVVAIGTLGAALTSAEAMPVQSLGGNPVGLEQARLVCGPYRCFNVRPYYRHYYHPYYHHYYRY